MRIINNPQLGKSARGYTLGMWCRLLKRHGFFKEKGKPIFTRHTLGNGGIYITKVDEGFLIHIHDIYAQFIAYNVTELRKVIECCNKVNERESIRWKQKILCL